MPTPNISQVMEAYAKDAEADARMRGITLDYSESSLNRVDQILEMLAPGSTLTPKSPAEEEQLWLLSKKYGGYIGQVVIKLMGGQWDLHDFPNGGSRVV